VGVCAASETMEGIGVVMPLSPVRAVVYYEKVRQSILKAERRISEKPKAATTAA